MKLSLKTLGIGYGILAVAFGVLYPLDRSVKESKAATAENTRKGPRVSGRQEASASKRRLLKRSRKLSSAEAARLLESIIIPRVDFKDITLVEALEFLNAEIAKQMPEDQPRPKVKIPRSLLKQVKDRRRADSQDEALMEALGEVELETFDEYSIEELRVINVPAETLLGYICAATKTRYVIRDGNAYVVPLTG